jgi:LEA14-like dessication related protein
MRNLLLYPTLLIIIGLQACTKIKEPIFKRIDNFKVKNIGFTSATIGFSVTYENPNNFGVTVKETVADVYIDNVQLGTFQQEAVIAVKNNSEFSIPITGSIPVGTFLKLNLQDISSREILLKATGSTKVGKAGIFITKPVQYEGKHRLNEIKL